MKGKKTEKKIHTSVRGSSASRFAAGIWSSRGFLDTEDDVVCSMA